MAFSLDPGLSLDSPWSSGVLFLENSLEDHEVSGQLVLGKIASKASVSAVAAPSHGSSVAPQA